MSRVKKGVAARKRHKKILSQTKGYRGRRRSVFRLAKQAVLRAEQNAYIGRKLKKRQFRSLWIVRINAACRKSGLSYSQLIARLSQGGVKINRKELSEIAASDPKKFTKIVKEAGTIQKS